MIDSSELAFIDCETTGLHPTLHDIWEVGLIVDDEETQMMIALTAEQLAASDPIALGIGRFHERHHQGNAYRPRSTGPSLAYHQRDAAAEIAQLTHGRHLVGACPWFDAQRLETLLWRNGATPGWHYHLIDSEALALGFLMGKMSERRTMGDGYADDRQVLAENLGLPWKSSDLSKMLGIDPGAYERHTALGDARWAKAMYEAIMGGQPG